MGKGYWPDKLADQVKWARTLHTVIADEPAGYGVPAALVTQLGLACASLEAAFGRAGEPLTRTRVAVQALRDALRAVRAQARNIVSIVQGTPGVSNEMKVAAGLTVRKTTRTPSPVPQTKPFIKAVKIDGRNVTLQLQQDTSKRGKPADVAGATVLTAAAAANGEVPTGEAWTFLTNTTRTTVEVAFPPSPVGNLVYVTAFWTNSRDESGPAAKPLAINLPASDVVTAAAAKTTTTTRLRAA